MAYESNKDPAPQGFDTAGWPLPDVRSMMVENFTRSWTRHWRACLILFFASVFLVLFSTWLVTPRWEGKGQILVEDQGTTQLSASTSIVTSEPQGLPADTMVANLIEVIKSRNLLNEVIDELKLDQYFENQATSDKKDMRTTIRNGIVSVVTLKFLRREAPINWKVKALDNLTSDWVTIVPLSGTTLVPLYVYGDKPEKTIEVGNAILRKLEERMNQTQRVRVEGEVKRLTGLVAEQQKKVAGNDRAISDFRKSIGQFSPAQYATEALAGLADLDQQKATLEMQMATAAAQEQEYRTQIERQPIFASLERSGEATNPQDQASQRIESDLANMRGDRAQKLLKYTAGSPVIRGIDAQIASMEQDLIKAKQSEEAARQSTGTTESIDPKYTGLFSNWTAARAQLASLDARSRGLDQAIGVLKAAQAAAIDADVTLTGMQRGADLDVKELTDRTAKLSQYQQLLGEASLVKGLIMINDTTIANPAKPDYPDMLLAGILAVALGIFAALVLPVAYDYLNQTLLSARQASTIPGIRVVAVVPKLSRNAMFQTASA